MGISITTAACGPNSGDDQLPEEMIEDTDDADQAEEADRQTEQHSDPRKDLSELKRMYGNFKTAYKVITAEIVWEAHMLSKCVAPIWNCNTNRLNLVPPEAVLHEVPKPSGFRTWLCGVHVHS